MIKIIEPGTKQIAICNDCGCKFSYEKEDILHFVSQGVLTITAKDYVICPQCHSQYTVRTTR